MPEEKQETELLKQWFLQNKISYSRFEGMEPLWETIFVNNQDKDKTVYELQLSNPKNIYQKIDGKEKNQAKPDKNFRLLIFREKVTGEIAYACYMSIIGDALGQEDLSSIHYKQPGSLSGKIIFFELDGTLSNGWEYSKGSAVKRLRSIHTVSNEDTKLMSLPGFKNSRNIQSDININNLKVMVPPPLACPIYSPVYGSTCVGVDGYMECTPYIAYYVCADPDNPVVGEYDGYGTTHGGGSGGGSSPTATKLDLSLFDRLQYPELGKIIDGLYKKVKDDPKLMASLKKFTNLSEDKILENLKSGQGPKLYVEDNPNRAGGYDPATNKMYISKHVITSTANNVFSVQSYSTALELYMAVSILHEFVHFGEHTTQIFLPHEGSFNDAGFQWENNMYGGSLNFNYLTGEITYKKL